MLATTWSHASVKRRKHRRDARAHTHTHNARTSFPRSSASLSPAPALLPLYASERRCSSRPLRARRRSADAVQPSTRYVSSAPHGRDRDGPRANVNGGDAQLRRERRLHHAREPDRMSRRRGTCTGSRAEPGAGARQPAAPKHQQASALRRRLFVRVFLDALREATR